MAYSIKTIALSLLGRRSIAIEWRLIAGAVMTLLFMSHHQLSADEIQPPKPLLAWGMKGDKPGEFYSPIGIAITRQDEVFVTDTAEATQRKSFAPADQISRNSFLSERKVRFSSLTVTESFRWEGQGMYDFGMV